jgi:hypothetical protein
MNRDLFRIRQVLPHTDPLYLAAAQQMVESVIPESCWLDQPISSREFFSLMSRHVPILHYELISDEPGGMIVKLLCYAEFAHGVGRYITDLFNRWLIPGKRISSEGGLSLKFRFVRYPERTWYFWHKVFLFNHIKELSSVLTTLPRLIEEAKLGLLAVYQARALASFTSLSHEQKNQIVKENLSSLFSIPYPVLDRTAYDQMQALILKLSEEEKIGEIKKNISSLWQYRSKSFDSDVFHEMTGFTSHYFRAHFATVRNPRHLSRIIALHYLFKKILLQSIQRSPHERHIRIKLFNAHESNKTIGILLGIHLFHETERFGKKHLLEAVQTCLYRNHLKNRECDEEGAQIFCSETSGLAQAQDISEEKKFVATLPSSNADSSGCFGISPIVAVHDSFVMDRTEEKARIFYLEIQKSSLQPFNNLELRQLRQELPPLLKKSVENLVHPIFMPRNEEEVLRTIVLLSKQIRYLRDLPHITIHYEKQTEIDIIFLVVLVRLVKETTPSFKEKLRRCPSSVRIVIDEVRVAGSLKRRIPKEAVIFRVFLEKTPFVRKDYSLDLKRARQKVSMELHRLLGEFRDFNGGMIHKQDEALEQLRIALGPVATHHEVLLENFFYSLRPGIMQTVHSSDVLCTFFDLFLKVLDQDLSQQEFVLKTTSSPNYLFLIIGAIAPTFKEEVLAAIARLKIASYDLTSSFLIVQESATLGFIFRSEDQEKRKQLQQVVLESMLHWKIHFSCQVKIS